MIRDETFDIADGFEVLRRNRIMFCETIIACAALALAIAFNIPKQFESRAILNIQSSYFQNPMVNGVVSEVNDVNELQSQRMSLLRLALSNRFIDSLASRFSLYSDQTHQSERALTIERQEFLQKIKYYSLSPTSFEISLTAGSPSMAQRMTTLVLERMKSTLIDERFENLARTKKAIENHVKNLGQSLQKVSTTNGEIAVQSELERVEATLSGLLVKFTESHPEVQKLRARQKYLASQQSDKVIKPSSDDVNDEILTSAGGLAKQPSLEVYGELIKKLNYLGIMIDMEKDRDNLSYLAVLEQPTYPAAATFPNKRIFLTLGLVIGVISATFLIVIAELGRRTILSPAQASDLLEAPLLGELPLFVTPLAESPRMKALPGSLKSKTQPSSTNHSSSSV